MRVVGWQAAVAHLLRHPQPTQDFHAARGHMVALHVRRLAPVAGFGHHDLDAALGQVHGQREAYRASADDKHLGGNHF